MGIPEVDGMGRKSVVNSLPTDTYPSRATMIVALIDSHADCVGHPPVPVPVSLVKTRLPTQVPTVGEAYILPFTCLSVHYPGSHSSSPSCTDTSNYLVPTIDSYTDEGMRPTNHVFSYPHERSRHP